MPDQTASSRQPFSICFVAPAAWPVLSRDRSIETVGGSEVQQCILARAFVALGHQVTMICMDHGQPDETMIDGVRVLKMHSPAAGIRILRFIHPRLTSLWSAMRRANADVYYQRNGGALTGLVSAWCRLQGRAFVYSAASNADFDAALPLIRTRFEKASYSWGLKHADLVVFQNAAQKAACRSNFRKQGILVPSCYMPPPHARNDAGGYVLWVSTIRRLKRPELFLELAARLPAYQFRMVGGPAEQSYYDEIRQAATNIRNLEFRGFVPYADIEAEFNGARLFVNTSEWEGFPNTFLQSWARAIPTVSYFDVGSVHEGIAVAKRVGSLDELCHMVDEYMKRDEVWRAAGERSAQHVLQRHSPEAAATDYSGAMARLLARSGKPVRKSPI